MNVAAEKNVRNVCTAIFLFSAVLYILSGLITHLKLTTLEASKINLRQIETNCTSDICSARWTFIPDSRFILLGQILRTHELIDTTSGTSLAPVNRVKGTISDSWLRLQVYEVKPGNVYEVRASKPSSAKLGFFVGILPRQTNNMGILSVPELGQTITSLCLLLTLTTLCIIISANLLSLSRQFALTPEKRSQIVAAIIASLLIALSAQISSGVFDSLFPEGDSRNRLLRTFFLAGSIVFAARNRLHLLGKTSRAPMFFYVSIIFLGSYLAWPLLRQGTYWAFTVGTVSVLGAIQLFRNREIFLGIFWLSGIIDALRILGHLSIGDYPPIYVNIIFALVTLGMAAGKAGGFTTIALAGGMFHRLRRDVLIESIKRRLSETKNIDSSAKIFALKPVMPMIADFLQAQRIALTINLPLGRPITQIHDNHLESDICFDDGTIPGAVTMRTILYGDNIFFESFSDYATRLGLDSNPNLISAKYFCTIPIRVNKSVVGTLMLTKFCDSVIEKKLASGDRLNEERQNIDAVVVALESCISDLIVQNLDTSVNLSKTLHKRLHEGLSKCSSFSDFVAMYAQRIGEICDSGVIIHTRVENLGVAVTHFGLPNSAWDFLCHNPLNLDPLSASPVGPTIVAFVESRSSYVKKVREISHQLHHKTIALFDMIGAESLAAIPLVSDSRVFVVTLFRSGDTGATDPAVVQIVESTEALFIAALEIMSQRTSVVALGELTSRLIGDAEIRTKIVEAAKTKTLPTTIGSPRSSLLLLFDLVGSSDLTKDTELKARAYGVFYDSVNRMAQDLFQGTIRKTIGDAVIITWDGHITGPSTDPKFLPKLFSLANYADQIANEIGCRGARALLHHGNYFLGLVGTETFGQIDVIGTGIDEVCKMEGLMKHLDIDGKPAKIAISERAVQYLEPVFTLDSSLKYFIDLQDKGLSKSKIRFASATLKTLKADSNVA